MSGLEFEVTSNNDPRLRELMEVHYSQPKGFVGRNICYAVYYDGVYYGHTVAGSSTRFLPGRNEFLGTNLDQLDNIINNTFFHIRKVDDQYPIRNFTSEVVKYFMTRAHIDWLVKYWQPVLGFETLVELPRTGELYKRAGWTLVGQTKGYTCKRVAGKGTDTWSGKRVWDTVNVRPKLVFCAKALW